MKSAKTKTENKNIKSARNNYDYSLFHKNKTGHLNSQNKNLAIVSEQEEITRRQIIKRRRANSLNNRKNSNLENPELTISELKNSQKQKELQLMNSFKVIHNINNFYRDKFHN